MKGNEMIKDNNKKKISSRHNIILKDGEDTLKLSLNNDEFNLLKEGMKKYPDWNNYALWWMMKNDKVCSKYHYNAICNKFYCIKNIEIIILNNHEG